jgi:hypothetical protein
MNYWVIILIILIVIILALLLAWPNTIKPKAMKYITNKVMQNIKVETPPAELQIDESGTFATIEYNYLGKSYTLRVPFERKLLRKVGYTVYHIHDDQEVEITNQIGIPILINASNLGGGEIIIKQHDEIIEKFTENQIVKF